MNELATTGGKKPRTVKELFEAAMPSMAMVIPHHVTPERLTKVALSAISRNEYLQKSSQQSLVRAVMIAAELGLDPGGFLGEAYLVPFKNKGVYEVQLIIGYRGLLKLARNSGELVDATAVPVYERDAFDVDHGRDQVVAHRPFPAREDKDDRGKLVAVWARLNLRGGGQQWEVMWRPDVLKVRERSRAKDNGPWITDEAEMWKKTVLRRALKLAPLSVEQLHRAFEAEDDESGPDIGVELSDEPAPSRGKALAMKLAKPGPVADVLDEVASTESTLPDEPIGAGE